MMIAPQLPNNGLRRDGSRRWERVERRMDFDQLVTRFFGTDDIGSLPPDQLIAGVERLRLQFGLEKDGGRRFALWCLLYTLGVAPDLDDAFDDEEDRNAARDFMDVADREIEDDG
ncbi:hypothetical protein ACBY01_16000 [Sphingomonas sp. ac-8]|uniref:hypothetical protein n=1 Tax=Sphingomonas sp. ac-8 TaxID=3242977 RepID=UPI003A7F7A07